MNKIIKKFKRALKAMENEKFSESKKQLQNRIAYTKKLFNEVLKEYKALYVSNEKDIDIFKKLSNYNINHNNKG